MRVIFVQPAVAHPLIRNQEADLFGYGLPHEAFEGFAINAVDHASRDFALAADRTNNRRLARTNAAGPATLPALIDMSVLREAADKGFVNFDFAEQLAFGAVFHRHANAMAHVPSSFIGASAEHTVDLKGAHSFLRVVHQERDLEPLDKRVFCVFEDGSGDDREPISILVAGFATPMEGSAFDNEHLGIATAWTMDAIRPATIGEERLALVLGCEPGDQLRKCHARFHDGEYNVSAARCQQADNRPNLT